MWSIIFRVIEGRQNDADTFHHILRQATTVIVFVKAPKAFMPQGLNHRVNVACNVTFVKHVGVYVLAYTFARGQTGSGAYRLFGVSPWHRCFEQRIYP